jgi:hypothetical protein
LQKKVNMKKAISLIVVVTALFFTSCKEEKKDANTETKEVVAVNKFFSVEIDAISDVENTFAVFYTEDNSISFAPDKAIWMGIKGQPQTQKVYFNFSEELLPTDIRLDFGVNDKQKEVILENVKMDYYGKSFQFKGSDFLTYYLPNDSIKTEVDQAKGTIKFLQNPKKFNPIFFYPNVKLLEEIKKITK